MSVTKSTFRSFPRKRESSLCRESEATFWIPASAGMSGVGWLADFFSRYSGGEKEGGEGS